MSGKEMYNVLENFCLKKIEETGKRTNIGLLSKINENVCPWCVELTPEEAIKNKEYAICPYVGRWMKVLLPNDTGLPKALFTYECNYLKHKKIREAYEK